MFTFIHALAMLAIAIFSGVICYALGKTDGRDEMCREIDEFYRRHNQRRA